MKRRKSGKNLQNSSSRQENDSPDSYDLISALPDSILSVILSFLPTKNAVATSILSKRWKLVWMTAHNLDFDDMGRYSSWNKDKDIKFVQYVNRVLLLPVAGLLNKFRLVWNPSHISSSDASSWINTAIARNVRELFLAVETSTRGCEMLGRFQMPDPFEMPTSVFSFNSLQSLELKGIFSLSEAVVVCLPRLESLRLDSFYFRYEEALERFISGCPMLNYLYINMEIDRMVDYFGINSDFVYVISSSSLRRFELIVDNSDSVTWDTTVSLKLDASSLECLKLDGFISKIFSQKSLSSLVEVDFFMDLGEADEDIYVNDVDMCDSIVESVRVFHCAKYLTLSSDVMWALTCASVNLSTEFKRLVKFDTSTYSGDYSTLQDFIQSSDNLENLIISQARSSVHGGSHSKCTTPLKVPRCLLNNLKKVEFECYYGHGYDDDVHEMICYMLKHGSALKVMKISLDSFKNNTNLKLLQDIIQFPRKSPACEVQFFG